MKYFVCILIAAFLPGAIVPVLGHPRESNGDGGRRHVPDEAVLDRLRKLAQSDPAEDFAAAKRNGDRRFLAIMGYAKTVPGVPDYDKKYAKYLDAKMIPGTTDAILTREQGKVLDAVQSYAERYNKLALDDLLKRLSKK